MNTLPFLCTGLQPSQRRLTEERVFMPRVFNADVNGVELGEGCVDADGRCRHRERTEVDLVSN